MLLLLLVLLLLLIRLLLLLLILLLLLLLLMLLLLLGNKNFLSILLCQRKLFDILVILNKLYGSRLLRMAAGLEVGMIESSGGHFHRYHF